MHARLRHASHLASSLTRKKNSQQGKKKNTVRKEKIQVGTINGENQRYTYFVFAFVFFLTVVCWLSEGDRDW